MRILFAIACACLALTGCQTATVDQAIAKNLPQVCKAATVAYTAFDAYAAVATVSAKDERRVDAAWDALTPLCVDPSGLWRRPSLLAWARVSMALALPAIGVIFMLGRAYVDKQFEDTTNASTPRSRWQRLPARKPAR